MSRSPYSNSKKAEATGFSQSFSFEEALRNAIESLPALPGIPTDPMERIKVMETGVERGGIASFNRIFVRVRHITPVPKRVRKSSRSR
jgi:hypothetical protein